METLERILLKAREREAMVVATIVDSDLRVYLLNRSMQLGIRCIDVLFPLLESLSLMLGQEPSAEPGKLRRMNANYFRRVWAIEYTVRHDDGQSLADIGEADIVLTGVSRTSKTPISMYLALKGFKVANVPLVPHTRLPPELTEVDQNRVVALIIDPERLSEIRTARVKALGSEGDGNYANQSKIFEELEWAQEIFSQNRKWPVLNVTGRAVEETAVEIEKIILARFPMLVDQIGSDHTMHSK